MSEVTKFEVVSWKDHIFGREELLVDGVKFTDCSFERSIIIYSGGIMPTFESCRFTGVEFRFRGPAMSTITTLQWLISEGLIPEDLIRPEKYDEDLERL
jgi:hypothetical protein